MSAAAFLLALCGFAALAAAMRGHFHALSGRAPPRSMVLTLRGIGWSLLGGSLWFCLGWLGSPIGLVAWFGLLNGAALVTALGLTLVKRLAKSSRLGVAGEPRGRPVDDPCRGS